jgi:DNA-binding MarR family transcriptional regulator
MQLPKPEWRNDLAGVVELTDSGRHVLEMAVDADTARERELMAGLSAAEMKALTALLKKLLSSLEPNGAGA